MILKEIILLSILAVASCKIEAAVVLFRHGARGPVGHKFDVYNQWAGKLEELTPIGAR